MLIPFNKITSNYKPRIHGVLHVGAHMCEELKEYNNYGLKNEQIIWVEANPELVKENLKIDKTRIIKNFIACEKDTGTTKLNIANNGQSSSILDLGTHKKNYPHIKYDKFIEVKNNRIDTMYKHEKIPNNFANFVNFDIQGAELLALKGMGNLLNNFDFIYTEVNKEKVYKDCALIGEIDDYLTRFNFKRVETKWTDQGWGDALYIKNDIKSVEHFTNNTESDFKIQGLIILLILIILIVITYNLFIKNYKT